ncbi:TetR/AcrR family transcriptional regulator C-terminal domain-containing protein [Cellulomonas sp. McL0617]|uniref:TetR/AcrR family transcriptional regulator C-terminal domain-containing protein n=1 Tax=Cellulomonas sp. McL0617 TaxID=3415675 RepID=UPI003CF1E127
MARQTTTSAEAGRTSREPLSRERALAAALTVADAEGLGAVTMRRLATELGVEAMSLYHHVANKDDVLDGITDVVIGEIHVPPSGTPWRSAMRDRAISAHQVLLAHPWSPMLIMSRFNIGPGMTGYLDATLGRLREGGFSIHGALDAWHTLDSHIYGFTLQELQLPFNASDNAQVSADVIDLFDPTRYPYVVEVVTEVSRTGRVERFEFGLDLILDGLERDLARQAAGPV